MTIDYDHMRNLHTAEGPRVAFPRILGDMRPLSVLDVGCGTGTWLRAALDSGPIDILGIDGIQIPADQLLIPESAFHCFDLTKPIDLGRRFDLALCLEVAEHLDEAYADTLVATLARHSDYIVFSAASPGQPGQHHVNCKWPAWWQRRFNDVSYVCDDKVRFDLWDQSIIEPWYRQNIFTARKDPERASSEPRLKPVIHPDMLPLFTEGSHLRKVENGLMPCSWYLKVSARALATKLRSRLPAFEHGRTGERA